MKSSLKITTVAAIVVATSAGALRGIPTTLSDTVWPSLAPAPTPPALKHNAAVQEMKVALAVRGAALYSRDYDGLEEEYSKDAQLYQYVARDGVALQLEGAAECAHMYAGQAPLGDVSTWTKQFNGERHLFHKVGSGSTFPDIVIETQIYDQDFKMLRQYVALAPTNASFAVSSSWNESTDAPLTQLQMELRAAYQKHNRAIQDAGIALLEGYTADAQMYQFELPSNKTTLYSGRDEIVAMYKKKASSNIGTPEQWFLHFDEIERLVFKVGTASNFPNMIYDVVLFDEQYKITNQYTAVIPIHSAPPPAVLGANTGDNERIAVVNAINTNTSTSTNTNTNSNASLVSRSNSNIASIEGDAAEVPYWNSYVKEDGVSHTARCTFSLPRTSSGAFDFTSGGSMSNFADMLPLGNLKPMLTVMPVGYHSDGHTSPNPVQLTIVLSGKVRWVFSSGEEMVLSAGDLFLEEEHFAKVGHSTENVGDTPATVLVQIAKDIPKEFLLDQHQPCQFPEAIARYWNSTKK